eukprot:jgi/Chrzof1/4911/Cz15g04070.t1_NSY[v5.2]
MEGLVRAQAQHGPLQHTFNSRNAPRVVLPLCGVGPGAPLRTGSRPCRRCNMRLQASAKAVTAKAAAAVLSPADPYILLQPATAFTAATVIILPVYLVLAVAPRSKLARSILDSPWLPLLYSVAYTVLMWQAWQQGLLHAVAHVIKDCHPLPNPHLLASLFQSGTLTAMAWLHLVLLDFLQAKSVLQDGMKFLVPTAHSVLLCFMFGPLGVLSHLLTKALMGKRRRNTVMLATSSFSDDHM